MCKNSSQVWAASIAKLAIFIYWIDAVPEDIEKVFKGNNFWVIDDLDGFDVARGAGCNFLVCRVCQRAATKSRDCLNDPFNLIKIRFDTPKTSTGKGRYFKLRGLRFACTGGAEKERPIYPYC